MKLSEIFTQLTIGEFKQLAIGGVKDGGIFEKNQFEVINHIQLGLTDLHTRFPLKWRKLLVDMTPGQVDYTLAPTSKDLIKVLTVWDQDGQEMVLNDAGDPDSVLTPSSHQLIVPAGVAERDGQLVVKYRADHSPLPVSPLGVSVATIAATDVDLPRTHLRALLLFVAWRAYTPTGLADPNATSVNYMQQYELACAMLGANNHQVDMDQQTGHERFERGGWI